jgi:hypothetical protein
LMLAAVLQEGGQLGEVVDRRVEAIVQQLSKGSCMPGPWQISA